MNNVQNSSIRYGICLLFLTTPIRTYQTFALEQDIEYGITLFNTQPQKAYEYLSTLAQTYPECPQIHCNKGIIALKQHNFEYAREAFETAIRYKPDYTKAHYHLAQLLEQHNLLDCPLNHLDKPSSSIKRSISTQERSPSISVMTEVSLGELIDKITILQIKQQKITDPEKLRNVEKELGVLERTRNIHITNNKKIDNLTQKLYEVNQKLWDIEDTIREKEHKQEFDAEFIQLARSVYFTNDDRFTYKKAINDQFGSSIKEEKSYKNYRVIDEFCNII